MSQRAFALAVVVALFACALLASLAKAQTIEAPPARSATHDRLVATKTCLDQFDALIAQRMPDRNPGEIRAIVAAGETYEVVPSNAPGWVWAIPSNPTQGTIKVSATCFQ